MVLGFVEGAHADRWEDKGGVFGVVKRIHVGFVRVVGAGRLEAEALAGQRFRVREYWRVEDAFATFDADFDVELEVDGGLLLWARLVLVRIVERWRHCRVVRAFRGLRRVLRVGFFDDARVVVVRLVSGSCAWAATVGEAFRVFI